MNIILLNRFTKCFKGIHTPRKFIFYDSETNGWTRDRAPLFLMGLLV